jgi:hypothetical protein
MEYAHFDSGRKRAWLLIKTEPQDGAPGIAQTIYNSLGEEGESGFVVIRADVVEGEFNIVVPVDANSEDQLEVVVKEIKKIKGVDTITIAKVGVHNPAPTYLAHGFVSYEEKDSAVRKEELPGPDEVGRIMKKSPGDNPWG